jgi:hypothetical protein
VRLIVVFYYVNFDISHLEHKYLQVITQYRRLWSFMVVMFAFLINVIVILAYPLTDQNNLCMCLHIFILQLY